MKFSTVTSLLLPALVVGSRRGLQDLVKVETDFNCLVDCTVSPGPDDCFQLTDDVEKQSGVVWSNDPLKIVDSFIVKVQLYFGTNDGPGKNGEFPNGSSDPGADGIAFVLQNQGSETVGRQGGGMGLSGIDTSLGVEFDTFQNKPATGDPAEDHLALVEDGELSNGRIVEPIPLSFNLEDGTYHDVTITWTSDTRTIDVAINGTVYLTHSGLDLTGILGGDFAYLGFTSSTGDSKNRHEVCVTSIQGTIYQSEMPSTSPSLSSAPSMTPSGSPSLTVSPSTSPSRAPVGSISGNVKEDTNNDDSGDVNLANVLMTLLDTAGVIVATTLTDAAGNYDFDELPLASYTVLMTNLPGYLDTDKMIDVTLTRDGPLDSAGNNFVNEAGRTISGAVFEDTDHDGVGDARTPNVLVQLVDSNGNSVASIFTDSVGVFVFNDIAPGVYTVVETNKADMVDVMDSDGGNPNVITLDVTSAGPGPVIFFVDTPVTAAPVTASPVTAAPVAPPTSISGNVKEDTNNDNAGDEDLANVLITLFDDSGSVVATTLTDLTGNYSFSDLSVASYTVSKTNLPGYLSTDNVISITFVPGGPVASTGNDFVDAAGKTISGAVLEDTDYNGVGDAPNAGVVVNLVDSNGNSVASTISDSNGIFTFDGVPPGVYTVVTTNTDNLVDVVDSDGGNPNVIMVDLTSDSSSGIFFVDAGITSSPVTASPVTAAPVTPARTSISGNVKEDTNDDDTGDEDLANVLITLLDAAGGIVATTLTDAAGNYGFSDLAVASYTVVKTNLPGYLSNGNSITVMFIPGGPLASAGNDFVDAAGKTISGGVVVDMDNNGVGDAPNAAVAVELVDASGNAVASTLTDSNGVFTFDGVPPGVYTVVQTNSAGMVDVMDSDGGDPNVIMVDVTNGDSPLIFFVDAPVTASPVTAAPVAVAPTCGKSGKKHTKGKDNDGDDDDDDAEGTGKSGKKSGGKSTKGESAGKKRGLRRLDTGDDDDDDDDKENKGKASKGKAGECDETNDNEGGVETQPASDGTQRSGSDTDVEESSGDPTFDLRNVGEGTAGDNSASYATAPIELVVRLVTAASLTWIVM